MEGKFGRLFGFQNSAGDASEKSAIASLEQENRALKAEKKELEKEIKALKAKSETLEREMSVRLKRADKKAEALKSAGEKKVWVIKCPAPDSERKVKWGDYHFAEALKKNLEMHGVFVQLDFREEFGDEQYADVVLVLRGNRFYEPQRWKQNALMGKRDGCKYIMWNISHPEQISDAEYELYDIVCVASQHYAETLGKRLSVPVYALLQCTDTERFFPEDAERSDDLIFVGNSRDEYRDCVRWTVESGNALKIWGTGWKQFLGERTKEFVQAAVIENSDIPKLYRTAGAVLNDHWGDMKEYQFINNRIFDALACAAPVITDGFPELKKIFPEAVLYYSSREDLKKCIQAVKNDGKHFRELALKQQELIHEQFSFAARARQLLEIAGK